MNGLIECPVCASKDKRQILGRVLEDGSMLVLRFHHGTTLIKASEYTISCGCGFSRTISVQGTVISMANQ